MYIMKLRNENICFNCNGYVCIHFMMKSLTKVPPSFLK